jgi:plastocyanin
LEWLQETKLRERNKGPMRRFALLVALGLVLGTASPASAAVVVTGPGGFTTGFLPPVVVIAEGEGITYTNADIAPHNFIALDAFRSKKVAKKTQWCSGYKKGKCPLFWSDTIGMGETTEVRGLEPVRSGEQYTFFCSLHPNMKGTLVVR